MIDLTAAYDDQDVPHTATVKLKRQFINTTVGRVIFNDNLPEEMPFINGLIKKKGVQQLVYYCYLRFGLERTVRALDQLKELGFHYATKSGISIGIDDMLIPGDKAPLVEATEKEIVKVQQQYLDGAITNGERYNKVIAIWSDVTEKVAEQMFKALEQQDKEGVINPIYVMADSGARGSKQQIRQLSGMRGLMAKPSGEVIETPITSNFREGLTVLQYFISTHGARKGLADTALKTADSGYLTRRLVDVAQDVIINEIDCGTADGIYVEPIIEAGVEVEPLRDRVVGRVSLERSRTTKATSSWRSIRRSPKSWPTPFRPRASSASRFAPCSPANPAAESAPAATAATWPPAAWSSSAKPSASSPRSPSASPARSSPCAPSTSAARRRASPSSPRSRPAAAASCASSTSRPCAAATTC